MWTGPATDRSVHPPAAMPIKGETDASSRSAMKAAKLAAAGKGPAAKTSNVPEAGELAARKVWCSVQHIMAASNAVVVSTMTSIGASIESSQWFGWAPAESSCPKGDKSGLASSVVVISNVRVSGVVVQGPPPSLCR